MFDDFKKANILRSWTTVAGYPAIVVAISRGHRCGFVQLPDNHPCSGKDCDDLEISVHGGVTYSEGNVFGFDCAHYMDAQDVTIMDDYHKKLYSTYPGYRKKVGTVKTTEFCSAECESMAAQFKRLENEHDNF